MYIFVVPRNGQALLDMPDTDSLNITINIHTIGAEQTGDSDKCCANMHTVQGDEPKQETPELRSVTQTWSAFQNITVKLSQWLRANHLKH